jgi:hypothetical protein
MGRRGLPLLALALLVALVAWSCGGGEVETEDVVSVIPWASHEEAHYRLEDRDGNAKGVGVLSVERRGETFLLTLSFRDDGNSDDSEVVVNAETLKPVSVKRVIMGEDQRDVVEGQYGDEGVIIDAQSDGDETKTSLRVPEHSYDNESSLFVWRTLPFEEGFAAAYDTIKVNQRERSLVQVEVVGRETVEVPAGTFETWRVDIRSGGVDQVAWYSVEPRRHLVKYDNSVLVFLLDEVPEESEQVRGPAP